jgi:hypothetical protein
MTIKSPFIVVPEFISPKRCKELINAIEVKVPNYDADGNPIKMERHYLEGEDFIFSKIKELVPEIESKYDAKFKGVEKMIFQYYPQNQKSIAENPGCENSKFLRKRWVKVKDVDLVGFLWLKDFNNAAPFDPRTEVYGGKLEFPAYNFSLMPQAGTLVIFPAGPHFITAISPIIIGDLYQVKINICISPTDGNVLWMYDPKNFQADKSGFIESWFREHA